MGPRFAPLTKVAAGLAVATVLVACTTEADERGAAEPGDGTAATTPATSPLPPSTTTEPVDLEALAAEAYVWGSPLVISQRTLQTLGGRIGINRLFWQDQLSGPETRVVVAPNRDTLYSVAVLDLRAEPQVLTVPEVTDRYWTYQLLDAWTESFAYLGTRATGGRAGSWAVTPPGWDGELPAGVVRLAAGTPLVLLLGRFLVDGNADVANVRGIAEQVSLEPLSARTGLPAPPVPVPLGAPPAAPQEVAAAGAAFYDELGDALAANAPITGTDRAELARFAPLGVGVGAHPTATADEDLLATLDQGIVAGEALIDGAVEERVPLVNGWRLPLEIGTYGGDTELRAAVARVGWGANVAEEAVYAVASVDGAGRPLDGAHRYRLRFEPGGSPPADAFWSLTLYGPDMFFVANDADRYAVGDRTPGLVTNPDGSLELLIQPDPPDEDAAGWLPSPAEGPFRLMLRLYLPGEALLAGDWAPPPIERIGPED